MQDLPFGFEEPEESPGFLLWQTTMLWQRQIKKALEPHGISHAQFVIMATLLWFEAHQQAITQSSIAAHSKLDKMTISKSLRKLAALGYVHRAEHAKDTRAKSALLTEKGKEMVRLLVPMVESIDTAFFSKISFSSQKACIDLLRVLASGD